MRYEHIYEHFQVAILCCLFEIADLLINECRNGFDNEIIKLSVSKSYLLKLWDSKYFNKRPNVAFSIAYSQRDMETVEEILKISGIDVN